jgi:predicted  nucleic acid-binding Zn-ribbon protein
VSTEPSTGAALDALWAVQQVDGRLLDARARLAALDDGTALRARVEAARGAAAEAAAALHQAQAAQRDQELQLQTVEAKQKKAHADLYGGRVSNPKELASLEEELEVFAKNRDHLEDQILSLFDQVEALKRRDLDARADLTALDAELEAHLAQYQEAHERITAEVAQLERDRAERAVAVEPRLLRKYEGIAAQEGGIGMVAVLGAFCGGCGNEVPARFVSRIREGQVVTCERCHRILYLDGAA